MARMPSVTVREIVAFLKRHGFLQDGQSGSHLSMEHPDGRRTTVPVHPGTDLGRGLAIRILKDAGFSVEDFLRLR